MLLVQEGHIEIVLFDSSRFLALISSSIWENRDTKQDRCGCPLTLIIWHSLKYQYLSDERYVIHSWIHSVNRSYFCSVASSRCTVRLFCSRSSSSISDNLNKINKMFETCKRTFTPVACFTKSCSVTGSKKNFTRFEEELVSFAAVIRVVTRHARP